MKNSALLVIDAQYAIVEQKDFSIQLEKISALIEKFLSKGNEVIFVKHLNFVDKESKFYFENEHSPNLCLDHGNNKVFVKSKPNAFSSPDLCKHLQDKGINELVIVGFNTEFCCMFTAIVAEHLGYSVALIEDACGTVNDDTVYEMPGLNINDFVGTVLDWSGTIQVLYFDEFLEG